jgi:predicted secreted protein
VRRRHFIKQISAFPLLVACASFSNKVWAQTEQQEELLEVVSDPIGELIKALFGDFETITPAKDITLSVPEIIRHIDSVPIRVEALTRKDIEAIALIVDENPQPLVVVSEFLAAGNDVYLSVRAHIEKNSLVRAVIKTSKGIEEISTSVEVGANF